MAQGKVMDNVFVAKNTMVNYATNATPDTFNPTRMTRLYFAANVTCPVI